MKKLLRNFALGGWAAIGLAVLCAGYPVSNSPLSVANLAALQQTTILAAAPVGYVTRVTDGVARSGKLDFVGASGSCAASSLVNDGARCVDNTTEGSHWVGQFHGTVDPLQFGAVGNGSVVVDGTSGPLQLALNAAGAMGLPLALGPNQFLLSTGLSSAASNVVVQGSLPAIPGNVKISACPTGVSTLLTSTSGITALTLTGQTGVGVFNTCFQMAAAVGTQTSGAAVVLAAGSGVSQGNALARYNTVIFPNDGIIVGSATSGPTQTNNDIVEYNTIIGATRYSLANGVTSSDASTVGTIFTNNQIQCRGQSGSYGYYIGDGAITLNAGDNGPFDCNIGTALNAATAGSFVGGQYTGVLGDTSLTHNLVLNAPSATGGVAYAQFDNCWAGDVGTAGASVLIENTGGGSSRVHNDNFTNCTFHGATTSQHIVDFENDVNKISMTAIMIPADGGGTGDTGIYVGGSAQQLHFTGINFQAENGSLATDITLAGTRDIFTFQSIDVGAPNTAILNIASWTATNKRMNFGTNPSWLGNAPVAVADAASVAAPLTSDMINITGTGTTITNMTNAWTRDLGVIFSNGSPPAVSAGGSGTTKFCNAIASPVQNYLYRARWSNGNCWYIGG